jgi:hypothetical protein
MEAFSALKAKAERADDPDATPDDPRVAEAEGRAFRAEIRTQAAIYGEAFTMDAVEVINLARTSNDPEALILALAGFRDKHAPTAAAPAPVATPAAASATPPADTGLSEGDVPSARPTSPAGRGESGAVTAVRGLFQKAAERATGART